MRLFTFGCSFTKFFWPTWADIIATDLDIDYHNYGISGMGNTGIQARIVEADFKHTMTTDDLAIVLWSSWTREDRFIDDQWKAGGNVFNNPFYDESFIDKYWSWENDIIKNSTAIHMTQRAYKDIIKFTGSIVEFPRVSNNSDITPFLRKIADKLNLVSGDDAHVRMYKDALKMPKLFAAQPNSHFNKQCSDTHPDVLCHLNYVENHIYPKLGYTVKDSTKQLFTEIQNELTATFKPEDSLPVLQEKVKPVLAKYNIKKSSI